jgi:hypothetical protein
MTKELLEYYNKEHFQFHFDLDNYVHLQDFNNRWYRVKWRDIVSNGKGIKRIQWNTKNFKKYIIVDIDNDNLFNFEKLDIPKPNFIVKNKNKQGGHLFWVIDRSVTHSYYQNVWLSIHKHFTNVCGGDKGNVGYIGKNPYNSLDFEYIEIYPYYYTLKELSSFVPIEEKEQKCDLQLPFFEDYKSVNKHGKVVSDSRNCDIFNEARKYAYGLIKDNIEDMQFRFKLLQKIKDINNQFTTKLEDKELKGIYKSILTYCTKHKNLIKNKSKFKNKMDIDMTLPIKEKQKLSAKYTNEVRKLKTQKTIEKAIIDLKAQGIKINIKNLADHTKIHRNTIKNFKNLF